MKIKIEMEYDSDGEKSELNFRWDGDYTGWAPTDDQIREALAHAAAAAIQHRMLKVARKDAQRRLGVDSPSTEEILVSAGILRYAPGVGYVPASAPSLPCEQNVTA